MLAVQFNSFHEPFVILLGSVPLAMFGAMIFTVLKMPNPDMPFWTDGWTATMNIYAQVGLVTLVGGMAVGTIFTLFVVPSLYMLFAGAIAGHTCSSQLRTCDSTS